MIQAHSQWEYNSALISDITIYTDFKYCNMTECMIFNEWFL